MGIDYNRQIKNSIDNSNYQYRFLKISPKPQIYKVKHISQKLVSSKIFMGKLNC